MDRIVTSLNQKWLFTIDKENKGMEEQWYHTGLPDYKEISIPHTFNVEPETEEYRGAAWYEYRFIPDNAWDQKRIRLHFNGVYRDTDVWMNGVFLGKHYNSGFTPFELDAGHALIMGKENILTVCVQNSYSQNALPYENRFDWADDGGIYREVRFIITDIAAIKHVNIKAVPEIHSDGSRQKTATAQFGARVILCGQKDGRNTMISTSDLSYSYEIYEDCENEKPPIYSSGSHPVTNTEEFNLNEISLNEVSLWHFDSPRLYQVRISLYLKGKLSDKITIPFGFREFKVNRGKFLLNGEIVRLVGTEWMPGSNPAYGNAEPKEYLHRILTQLKESNCIFTRFHWQQDESVYEWCDRNGMLVQEEIPNWGSPKSPGEVQMECSKQQADEMILSHYNHPSIISWGMANELNGQHPQTVKFMEDLKQYIKKIDPIRPVTYITNTMWEGVTTDATLAGDFLMINEYIGTWHGNLDTEEELRKVVQSNPDEVLVMSEFGLCEPAFTGGDKKRGRLFQHKMNIYRKFPQIGGIINFCLNDYRTQMGEEGKGMLRRRVHGSTDLFGEPKPSYYIVQEDCSPVKVLKTEYLATTCTLTLEAASDLPCYLVEDYYLRILDEQDKEIAKTTIPTLKPGENCKLTIDIKPENRLQICRPNGFLVRELL